MTWLRLSISCPQEYLDDLRGLLESFSAASISYTPGSPEAVFDDPTAVQQYWKITNLTALLDPDIDMDILMACVRNRIGTQNILGYQLDLLKDEDWEGAFKAGFGPVTIKDTLCVCPSWTEAPEGIACLVKLDPGLAFGTGTHETTSLCLEWLVDNPPKLKRVIDYGCGSGILGITAAKLGAKSVTGIDIDPQAVTASIANAEKNEVQDKFFILKQGNPGKHSADILIANILLEPLLLLAGRFNSYLVNDGRIVLSGLLANQVDDCLGCYSDWFDMSDPVFKNEWAMLTGVKKMDLL
jgi:ribosomal protein L11 methyltransferase